MTATKPRNALVVEEWLESHGATAISHPAIDLDQIDDRRSLQNQARFQALDERLVVTYAEAMRGNANFPPIVVADDGDPRHRLLVIDGNHRVAAARLSGKTSLPALIVRDATERQIHVLTFDANTKHGQPTSAEERKAHAVYLVETAGVTQREAALMLNVPLREINDQVTLGRVNRRLASFGLERWEEISKTNRTRLENIGSDRVLRSAADLVIKAKLDRDRISDLVTEINKARTEDAALAVVEAAAVASQPQIKMTVGGRTRPPAAVMRLQRSLTYAETIVVEHVDPATFDAASKEAMRIRIAAAIAKLEDIADRLR